MSYHEPEYQRQKRLECKAEIRKKKEKDRQGEGQGQGQGSDCDFVMCSSNSFDRESQIFSQSEPSSPLVLEYNSYSFPHLTATTTTNNNAPTTRFSNIDAVPLSPLSPYSLNASVMVNESNPDLMVSQMTRLISEHERSPTAQHNSNIQASIIAVANQYCGVDENTNMNVFLPVITPTQKKEKEESSEISKSADNNNNEKEEEEEKEKEDEEHEQDQDQEEEEVYKENKDKLFFEDGIVGGVILLLYLWILGYFAAMLIHYSIINQVQLTNSTVECNNGVLMLDSSLYQMELVNGESLSLRLHLMEKFQMNNVSTAIPLTEKWQIDSIRDSYLNLVPHTSKNLTENQYLITFPFSIGFGTPDDLTDIIHQLTITFSLQVPITTIPLTTKTVTTETQIEANKKEFKLQKTEITIKVISAPKPVFGIDLGTAYGCMALNLNETIIPIKLSLDALCLPMHVTTDVYGNITAFGLLAKLTSSNGDNSLKTRLGRNSQLVIQSFALLLAHMRQMADAYVTSPFSQANTNEVMPNTLPCVITVPAKFTHVQRKEVIDIAELAGWKVIRLINEPTAAALAHQFISTSVNQVQNTSSLIVPSVTSVKIREVLVFDYGAGTTDVALVEVDEENVHRVILTDGDMDAGGNELDKCLYKYFTKKLMEEYDIIEEEKEIHFSNTALLLEAERAKRALSIHNFYSFELTIKDHPYQLHIQRQEFEDLCYDHFKKALLPLERVLQDYKQKIKDVESVTDLTVATGVTNEKKEKKPLEVIMVGGGSAIPFVRNKLTQLVSYYTPSAYLVEGRGAPEFAVSIGAAILGSEISKSIHSTTTEKEKEFSQKIFDVTPAAIGVRIYAQDKNAADFHIIIPRNTIYPTNEIWIANFSSAFDYQCRAMIDIYEGYSTSASENAFVGRFHVQLPSLPQGQAFINLKLRIDESGCLIVAAESQIDGQTINIAIYSSNSTSINNNNTTSGNSLLETQHALWRTYNQLSTLFSSVPKRLSESLTNIMTNDLLPYESSSLILPSSRQLTISEQDLSTSALQTQIIQTYKKSKAAALTVYNHLAAAISGHK